MFVDDFWRKTKKRFIFCDIAAAAMHMHMNERRGLDNTYCGTQVGIISAAAAAADNINNIHEVGK